MLNAAGFLIRLMIVSHLMSVNAFAQGRLSDHFRPDGQKIVLWSVKGSGDLAGAFRAVFGDCSDPCPMPADSQGIDYGRGMAAAVALRIGAVRRTVVINTECRGECVAFADRARRHVCLGPGASFAFYRTATATPIDPPFSDDLMRWGSRQKIVTAGPSEKLVFPLARKKEDALIMRGEEAIRLGIWKACDVSVVALAFPN